MIKYLVFYGTIVLGIPVAVFITWLRQSFIYLILLALMISLCMPETTSITFESREFYRMATRGFEINLADLCALILLFSMLLYPGIYRIKWIPPLTLPYLLLAAIAVVSWSLTEGNKPIPYEVAFDKLSGDLITYRNFELSLYPLFELLKIARGFFIYWVMVNFMQDPKARRVFLFGVVGITFYVTGVCFFQRYGLGIHRASANIGHVNDFNTFVGLIGAFATPFAFQTKGWKKSFIYWCVIGGGFLSIVLTISRSSLAGYALAAFIGMIIGLVRWTSVRNVFFVGLAFILALGIMVRAADTLIERFFHLESYEGSMSERRLFMAEAKLMAKDRIFGVGLGNFSAWSWLKYSEETEAPPGALAHNIYYLTLGELGYVGLMAFVIIWLRYYQMVGKLMLNPRVKRNDELYAFVVAAFIATMVLQLQNLFHFSYRHTSVYYMLNIMVGVTTAAYLEARATRRAQLKAITVPA